MGSSQKAHDRQSVSDVTSERAAINRPDQDEDRTTADALPDDVGIAEEPRGVQNDIADADKNARTGSRDEQVRNTPPAGDWNDVV
jgi:hypothetical protein